MVGIKKFIENIRDGFVHLLPTLMVMFWVAYIVEPVPIEYPEEPFKLDHNILKRGEEFTLELDRCARRTTNYSWTQAFVNSETGHETLMPGSSATASKGCSTVTSVVKTVPEDIELGRYRLVFFVRAEGVLQDFEFMVRTEEFEVIN